MRRSLRLVFCVLWLSSSALCSLEASDPCRGLYFACTDDDGAVRIVHRSGDSDTEVASAPGGMAWLPFGIRRTGGDAAPGGGVIELGGPAPRLQVRASFELVSYA